MFEGIFSAIGESIGQYIVPGLAVIGGTVVAAQAIRQGGQVAAHCRRGDWLDAAVSGVGLVGSPIMAASAAVVSVGDSIRDAGEAWQKAGGDVVPSTADLMVRAGKVREQVQRRLQKIAEEAILEDEKKLVDAEVAAQSAEVAAEARRRYAEALKAEAEAQAEKARAAAVAAEAEKVRAATAAATAPKPGVICTTPA